MLNFTTQPFFWIALIANFSVLAAVIAYRDEIASVTGLMDDSASKPHARHTGSVPLVGGLAFVASVLSMIAVSGLVFAAEIWAGTNLEIKIAAASYVAFVCLFFGMGLADDQGGLSPRRRLVFSAVFVVILLAGNGSAFVLSSVEDRFLGVSIAFGWLSPLVTCVAIIALVNALNMSDGRNGIVAGIGCVWSVALLFRSSDPYVATLLSVSALNCLILGLQNLRGRLFFGDAGSYAIASAFGAAAIVWHSGSGPGFKLTSLEVCSLFLILVLDMVRLIFARTLSGRSPMAADHNHLHHRLDDSFGWPKGLAAYLILVATPVLIAFQDFEAAGVVGIFSGILLYVGMIAYTRRSTLLAPGRPPKLLVEAE